MKNTTKKNGPKIGFMGPKFLKVALVIIAVGFICGMVNAAVQTDPQPQAAEQVAQAVDPAAEAITTSAAETVQPETNSEEVSICPLPRRRVPEDEVP